MFHYNESILNKKGNLIDVPVLTMEREIRSSTGLVLMLQPALPAESSNAYDMNIEVPLKASLVELVYFFVNVIKCFNTH